MPEFAGKLRHRLTLESPSETVTNGEATPVWTTEATVWGQMDGLTGLNRNGLTADAEYRFTIRYRSDLTPRWRLGLGDRKFGIISALDREGRRRELTIFAREILA